MKRSLFLLLTILVISTHMAFSQDKNKAEFKEIFEKADAFFDKDNYKDALPLFMELNHSDPENSNIQFLVGLCFLNTTFEKAHAISYLEQCISNITPKYVEASYKENRAPLIALEYLGDAYHITYKFDQAIEAYTNYLSKLDSTKDENLKIINEVNYKIQTCINAKELVKVPINIRIENLGDSINSPFPDYAPLITADEKTLMFTSRREGSVGGNFTDDGEYYEDIYVSNKVNGVWSKPRNVKEINTPQHEATIALTPDGQNLLIYKDDKGNGDIYLCTKDSNGLWTNQQLLGSDINSPAWETHASLSQDGNMLFFVSNRVGGLGGRDIYSCKKLPNGSWAMCQNLGSAINTPYEEETPYIHPDGKTIFFSSQGHNSMGGFDIFFSQLQDDGTWSEPMNMGYPVNTTGDDVFYIPSLDGIRAYYGSNKIDGFGEKDIYMITLPESHVIPLTVIKGVLMYEGTRTPVEDGLITVTDVETGELAGIYRPNSYNGKFLLILNQNKTFSLTYEAGNAEQKEDQMAIPSDESVTYNEKYVEIFLKPIDKSSIVPKKDVPIPVIEPVETPKVVENINEQIEIANQEIAKEEVIENKVVDEVPKEVVQNIIEQEKTKEEIIQNTVVQETPKEEITEISEEQATTKIVVHKSARSMIIPATTKKIKEEAKIAAQPDNKKATPTKAVAQPKRDVPVKTKITETPKEKKAIEKAKETKVVETQEVTTVTTKEGNYTLKNVLFEYNSSTLSKEDISNLDNLCNLLKQYDKLMIRLKGYTDAKGTDEYNIALAKRRCNAIYNYLVNKGIKPYRFLIDVYGKTKPIAINNNSDGSDNAEGRKFNRRVEFSILNTPMYSNMNIYIEEINVPEDLKVK